MTDEDVVGGGSDTREVLDGDEGNIVEEHAKDTEPHLSEHQD